MSRIHERCCVYTSFFSIMDNVCHSVNTFVFQVVGEKYSARFRRAAFHALVIGENSPQSADTKGVERITVFYQRHVYANWIADSFHPGMALEHQLLHLLAPFTFQCGVVTLK